MKRKIVISSTERTSIAAALVYFGMVELAHDIDMRFREADPANDGAEVAILSVEAEA
jgi:hypothetical protein